MGGGFLKALFGVIAFVVFIGLLCVEIVANGGTATTVTATSALGSSMHFEPLDRGGPTFDPDLDLNYMSKRRVPNGPDPIHNRRAGKSRQQPGRA